MAQGLHFGLKAGVLGNKANVSGMRNQFKEESLTGFQVGPMLQYQTGFHGIALDFSTLFCKCKQNSVAIQFGLSQQEPYFAEVAESIPKEMECSV